MKHYAKELARLGYCAYCFDFCDSAWDSISAFVMTLAHGGGNFYDGWMKAPNTAMISCNDGFRPVSFYLEALDEDAE